MKDSSPEPCEIQGIQLTDIQCGLSKAYVTASIQVNKRSVNPNIALGVQVFLQQLKSIFFFLLLISSILSYYLGNHTDAFIFILLNFANVAIGFLQEFRANKASRALINLIPQYTTVVRDGAPFKICCSDLIPGDIIHLKPGDVCPSDVLIRSGIDITIDDSMRTGESVPQPMSIGQCVYAGASVIGGVIVAQILLSNDQNSLAQYNRALNKVYKDNDFAKFVKKISTYVLLITVVAMCTLAIYGVLITDKYTPTSLILFTISMLIGVVPESLSLIITLILAREAGLLVREGVIIKNLTALQQLGSIAYLLTDKTGTLTLNDISIVDTYNNENLDDVLCVFCQIKYDKTPMDDAFDRAISSYLLKRENLGKSLSIHDFHTPTAFYPFSNNVGYSIFEFSNQSIYRGQFDSIINEVVIPSDEKERVESVYRSFESKGLRVIAFSVAKKTSRLFAGMIALEDPLKPDAQHSYLASEGLGIRVKILTGDSALVSQYVAYKLSPSFTSEQVVDLSHDGETKINKFSDADIIQNRIYARCRPEHKLSLINKHLEKGPVGFMGEGINDALALKRADIGIAVVGASEVARQSADMILTREGLNPVIKAIQLSRRAYAHISMYLMCTLTGNLGTLLSITLVALFWNDLPMLPIQILLNNLLTDVPLILLITDKLAKEEYSKPISHSPRAFFRSVFIFGLISSVFDMFYFMLFKDQSIELMRTGWFVFSVLAELALVLSLRTKLSLWKAKRISLQLLLGITMAGLISIALTYIPVIGTKLSLVPIPLKMLGTLLLMIAVYIGVNELYKAVIRKNIVGR